MVLQDLIVLLNIFIASPTQNNMDEIKAFANDPDNQSLLSESGHDEISKALEHAITYRKKPSKELGDVISDSTCTSKIIDLREIVPEIKKIKKELEILVSPTYLDD